MDGFRNLVLEIPSGFVFWMGCSPFANPLAFISHKIQDLQ
jgi:hypothetical protein